MTWSEYSRYQWQRKSLNVDHCWSWTFAKLIWQAWCFGHQIVSYTSGKCHTVPYHPPRKGSRNLQNSTFETIKILQNDMLGLSNVTNHQEPKPTLITKYDLKIVLSQAKPVLNESSFSKFAQLLRCFSVVFSKKSWTFGHAISCKLEFKITLVVFQSSLQVGVCEWNSEQTFSRNWSFSMRMSSLRFSTAPKLHAVC